MGPLVLAVDGNSLVHRSFHALQHSGHRDWAVRGLLGQLLAAADRFRPQAIVVGFDDPARSERRERWPSYKAHRSAKVPELVAQLIRAEAAVRGLGLAAVTPDGLEADDVLASAARFAGEVGGRCVVVTSDRDSFSLISETTRVLRVINGGVDASPLLTPERLVTLLGVRPDQYRDFAALRGDPSDNLPGVRGIGATTAARLLSETGSVAAALADLDTVRERVGAAVATRLSHPDARTAWEHNCAVMAQRDDVPLDLDPRGTPGTPGVLPLTVDRVESAFHGHGLVWSAGLAREVLAHDVTTAVVRPQVEPDRVEPRVEPDHVGPAQEGQPDVEQALAELVEQEQLALF